MDLETSLGYNNEYRGLHGEVVDYDIYELRTVPDVVSVNDPNYVHWKGHEGINFVPDVVIDLGGNVGIFSRYAKSLWPNAQVIAIEPDARNCEYFRTFSTGINLINAAIGDGEVYHGLNSANGAMQVYLTEGPGYNSNDFNNLVNSKTWERSSLRSIMLPEIFELIEKKDGKKVLKIDIEGNETVIFNDPASMELIKTFDYIAMELHYYSASQSDKVREITDKALDSLKETHNTKRTGVYFYARKK